MSEIGIGMAALGRPEYINIRQDKNIDKSETAFKENALKVLDLAYARGIRFFDTAPSYGKGEAFLKDWDYLRNHSDAVLSTKWGYTYVANWQLGYNGSHEIKEHSIEKLLEQWEVSKVLISKLKVYQIHSATLESGVLENDDVLNALAKIKKDTGVKIGLTVSGANQSSIIERAINCEVEGVHLFDSFQVTFNVFEQSTFELLVALKKMGKFVIIKEGLANGRVFLSESNVLKMLSEKYNVGVDAIALRFCMDAVLPDVVLSGAANEAQLEQNLKVNTFQLAIDEIDALKALKVSSSDYWSERSELNWD
ncbi:aldo/keto reductase [Flavicella marina]|uniref:aldo/keto reductase n=1 Tax=Flavicella marina TaxID=1475951 RepID=UPI0012641750|nr:aldo/keto reductase [Flavicella marina]